MNLEYADDTDTIGSRTIKAKEWFIKLEKEPKNQSLTAMKRTKYMHVSRRAGRYSIWQNTTKKIYNFEFVQKLSIQLLA